MFVRWYRRWTDRRSKRAAEHYPQLGDDQVRAVGRYHDRGPIGAAGTVAPRLRDTEPP